MPLTLLAGLVLAASQKSSSDLQGLRKYRYGLSAEKIVAMGRDAFYDYYERRTPDADYGYMRGVGYGVFVDAKRELNGRRRTKRPSAERTRLLALDKQMRFIGVLAARNEWLFHGGNAVDPDGDTEAMADAETEILIGKSVEGGPNVSTSIAMHERRLLARARSEQMFGALKKERGIAELRANMVKMRAAAKKAVALTRGTRERGALTRFVDAVLNES